MKKREENVKACCLVEKEILGPSKSPLCLTMTKLVHIPCSELIGNRDKWKSSP